MLPRAVSSEDLTGAEESASNVAHSCGCWQEATVPHQGLAGDFSSSPCGPLYRMAEVFS